ncbi:DEAD/DEAH box helicase [Paraburkholderia bryophila]|uniref:Superfamily II DNA or RNA helicase n=1 Tax=Paraburkholderia bryophila TaxID=420952 RepID=A0A7Z0B991_9BURK|nr:DEAD/DEAH box helicase family protein [Paraburkholderia bryophila]NYH24187.1 superfamily II DNA or RNA helicase [Paraburkholderia bryophila]
MDDIAGERLAVATKTIAVPPGVDRVLVIRDATVLPETSADWDLAVRPTRWSYPPVFDLGAESIESSISRTRQVVDSWNSSFQFKEEWTDDEGVIHPGLRPPQMGALYAALAHWRVSTKPATVVMPTGTGKTDTMLALLVAQRIRRLLVLVPSDALREQVSGKFVNLGWLKKLGLLGDEGLYPVVGLLKKMSKDRDSLNLMLNRCNVVVATMSIAANSRSELRAAIAQWATHVFIDEAHHVSATTWAAFRKEFGEKPVLQFTATPFRSDGKLVDGKVIFNYPLSRAQAEKYFKPIRFRPVVEYNDDVADMRIMEEAVAALRSDVEANLDHVLMARVRSIPRAIEVYRLYKQHAPDLNPQIVHSEQTDIEKLASLRALRGRTSRIIVAVDMLGEGFDLPQLKVAALHDMHKSLAITLQFTGRFTRSSATNIGDATVVANIADVDVAENLQALYAEDAEWGELLRVLSEGATEAEVRRSEFLGGFGELAPKVALQNIFPKMSAVVYQTEGTWTPDNIAKAIKPARMYAGPFTNVAEKVVVFVTKDLEQVPWGDVRDLKNTTWNVFILHWSEEQRLLFINSSDNSSVHEELARAVCGLNATLIRGEQIFKSLHGVSRFLIMNLGLRHLISKTVQFSMHSGSDVGAALTLALRQNRAKSNLFGRGYERGARVTVGCSQKGRLWSHRVAYDLSKWVDWCHEVGAKLTNPDISTEDIFKNVVIPEVVSARPDAVPLAVDWSEEMLHRREDSVDIEIAGITSKLFEVELQPDTVASEGPLRIRVRTPDAESVYEIRFAANDVSYVLVEGSAVYVAAGRKRESLEIWWRAEPPTVYFSDGSSLIFNEAYKLPATERRVSFAREELVSWDWNGINIRKESQGPTKAPDSIQRRVIDRLLAVSGENRFDIIFDDDGSGEMADVVAVNVQNGRIEVCFYHCKYSLQDNPGARIDDLYVVCGQAQRSVFWKGEPERLFRHLQLREVKRQRTGRTRFERGDLATLATVSRSLRANRLALKIFVVQPGVKVDEVSPAQLELLGVTELYLRETYDCEFEFVGS